MSEDLEEFIEFMTVRRDEPMIFIDDRERVKQSGTRNEFLDRLTDVATSANVVVQRLKVGDFLLTYPGRKPILVERKTITDLRSSVRGKHIFKQVDSLVYLQKNGLCDSYFLVESKTVFGIDDNNRLTEKDLSYIMGLTNMLSFCDLGPLRSESFEQTCDQLYKIHMKQAKGGKWSTVQSRPKPKSLNIPEDVVEFLNHLGFTDKILETMDIDVLNLIGKGEPIKDLKYSSGRKVADNMIRKINRALDSPLNVILCGVRGVGTKTAKKLTEEHGFDLYDRDYLNKLKTDGNAKEQAVASVFLFKSATRRTT